MQTAADLAFTDNRIAFSHTRLRDAIPELKRWYDVDIRLADDGLGGQAASGSLPVGSVANLCEILQFLFHARAVQSGRVITLYNQ